jgi:hypothetical protein
VLPLGVFVIYSFASFYDGSKGRRLTGWLQTLAIVYLAGYVAVSLLDSGLFFVHGERGERQLTKLIGGDATHWPSMAVTYELSPARNYVLDVVREEPNTLFLTSKAGWFYWDPAIDHSKLSELRCWDMRAAYLSGPARIVILTFDLGEPNELWYLGENGSTRADCFGEFPDMKLLKRFPAEQVKVLEAHIDAGTRFPLHPSESQ